jgi:tRNA(Ile)-lysidine synthase
MLKQFLNHIEQHDLCTKDQTVLLAVSGGLDSMVMLHYFLKRPDIRIACGALQFSIKRERIRW